MSERAHSVVLLGLLLSAGLSVSSVSAAPPPAGEFYVNSRSQAVTFHALYLLHEGRAYTRPRESGGAWRLVGGTGLPPDSSFITRLAADASQVAVVNERGEIWRYDSGAWVGIWGLPAPGLSRQEKLLFPQGENELVLSIRDRDVLFYEDIRGNAFHYGTAGCTTVFVLNPETSRIQMGDPWFPPDLSRQMCGPERGGTRLLSLSASASTSLAVAADGALYTRFFDYDVNGGTPFFAYRYFDRAPIHGIPGAEYKSGTQTHALPPEDWKRESAIELGALGRLTKRTTVLQTGQGNGARELRVLGLGPEGQVGYYFKGLREMKWSFRATPDVSVTEIAESEWLTAQAPAAPVKPRDRSYSGTLTLNDSHGQALAQAQVKDLNFHCSPFTLELSTSQGERAKIRVHAVDAWAVLPSEDPDFSDVAPKQLKLTVEVLSAQGSLARLLKPYQLESFAWAATANAYEAVIRPVRKLPGARLDWTMRLTSTELPKAAPQGLSAADSQDLEARRAHAGFLSLILPAGASVLKMAGQPLTEHLPALLQTERDSVRLRERALRPR